MKQIGDSHTPEQIDEADEDWDNIPELFKNKFKEMEKYREIEKSVFKKQQEGPRINNGDSASTIKTFTPHAEV